MNLYPVNLVLTTALAWATIFWGVLPPRLLCTRLGVRSVAAAGAAWLLVAVLAPPQIIHYYVFLALICFYAARRLHDDQGLAGKVWLCIASALGVSAGVVLMLALRPQPAHQQPALGFRIVEIASIYLGGAVLGLAVVLYFFTRRSFTEIGIPERFVRSYARLLLILTLVRIFVAGLAVFEVRRVLSPAPQWTLLIDVGFGILVVLAVLARKQAIGPAPSRSGFALLAMEVLGFILEVAARLG